MKREEIFSLAGFPTKTVHSDNGDVELLYYGYQIVLKLEIENDMRLGWIEVKNHSSVIAGVDIWNLERNYLLTYFQDVFNEKYELDDYGEMESYTFSDSWVEFQFILGKLDSVNFGVKYATDGSVLWPTNGMTT